jgi:hypothetical protein
LRFRATIASGKATFTNQEIVAIEDANRQNTAEPNSSMGSFLTEHPLQTQGTAMF